MAPTTRSTRAGNKRKQAEASTAAAAATVKDASSSHTTQEDNKTEMKSQAKARTVTFILLPGASSKEPTELKGALESIGKVHVLTKWNGIMPAHLNANVDLVLELCRESEDDKDGSMMILVGHSFGTRVIVTLLSRIHDGTIPPKNVPKSLQTDHAILESYPLYGPSQPKNQSTDRVATLQKAPKTLQCLFVSGDNDEFLDRRKNWRPNDAPIGGEALQQVVDAMPSRDLCTVKMISNGKHNCLKATKANRAAVMKEFQTSVRDFLKNTTDCGNDALVLERNTQGTLTGFFKPAATKKQKTK